MSETFNNASTDWIVDPTSLVSIFIKKTLSASTSAVSTAEFIISL